MSDKITILIIQLFIEMLKQQHQDISCANNCQSDLFFSLVSGFRETFFEGFLTPRSSKFQHFSSLDNFDRTRLGINFGISEELIGLKICKLLPTL